jgi:hypothetical protein
MRSSGGYFARFAKRHLEFGHVTAAIHELNPSASCSAARTAPKSRLRQLAHRIRPVTGQRPNRRARPALECRETLRATLGRRRKA